MDDHTHSDTPRVYHDGRDAAHVGNSPTPPASPPTRSTAPTGNSSNACTSKLTIPDRFAVYADSETTEDTPNEELPTSGGFDPANVLMWGLEHPDEAVAYRRANGSWRHEQFLCESAERVRQLLELAGHGPLRILYL